MTRLSEKLRLSSLVVEPTRFISQKLTHLSLTAFDLCRTLARFLLSKTAALLTMEDLFADQDNNFWNLDYPSQLRPTRRYLEEEERNLGSERVYLIPYRWWKEAESDVDRVEGVLYTVSTNTDSDSEIFLNLRKEDDHHRIESTEVGVSGRQYALVAEGMWLRALKR